MRSGKREIFWCSFLWHLNSMKEKESVFLVSPKGRVTIMRGKGDTFAAKGGALPNPVKLDLLGMIRAIYLSEYTR